MIAREPLGREANEVRPISIETGVNRYAEGSVLIRAGHTHVLCTASVEESVPKWMTGKNRGWITAEYSMLPRSTHTRTKRDREKMSGRTHEIQRLIGRALRTTVDLSSLGERSILVDCDVVQADGGTRTAAITGGCVAVLIALDRILREGRLPGVTLNRLWRDTVSAVSVGIKQGEVLVDLDYNEDSSTDVDMNFVITGSGDFVEVQGTAEGEPFSRGDLESLTAAAQAAATTIRTIQLDCLARLGIVRG